MIKTFDCLIPFTDSLASCFCRIIFCVWYKRTKTLQFWCVLPLFFISQLIPTSPNVLKVGIISLLSFYSNFEFDWSRIKFVDVVCVVVLCEFENLSCWFKTGLKRMVSINRIKIYVTGQVSSKCEKKTINYVCGRSWWKLTWKCKRCAAVLPIIQNKFDNK